jgi:hypothetical protein
MQYSCQAPCQERRPQYRAAALSHKIRSPWACKTLGPAASNTPSIPICSDSVTARLQLRVHDHDGTMHVVTHAAAAQSCNMSPVIVNDNSTCLRHNALLQPHLRDLICAGTPLAGLHQFIA